MRNVKIFVTCFVIATFILLPFVFAIKFSKTKINELVKDGGIDPVTSASATSSVDKPTESVDVPPEPLPEFTVEKIGDFTVKIPSRFEKIKDSEPYDLIAINKNVGNILAFKKESFPIKDKNHALNEFVLSEIRTLRNDNVDLLDVDKTFINDQEFFFYKSQKNELHSIHFYTFENGFGYQFNCGGFDTVNLIENCMDVINSIKK